MQGTQPQQQQQKKKEDYVFKYVLVGESGTGKTSLSERFTKDKFDETTSTTQGVEFSNRSIEINGKICKLQVWDTAGQEKFRAIVEKYYRGCYGVLLVYDISNRASFNSIIYWLGEVKRHSSSITVYILIGNKCDLDKHREVTIDEANRFAIENNLTYLETSAKTGANVEEAFIRSAHRIYENVQNTLVDSNTTTNVTTKNSNSKGKVSIEDKQKSSGSCC